MSQACRLAELDVDEFEIGLLSVARHFLSAATDPASQGWRRAFTIATERWGEAQGLAVAYQLSKLISAALQCRTYGLCFNDPLCPDSRRTVTSDERALLEMLHHMRRDDTPSARQAVDALTKGVRDPHVIQSGLTLASRFPCGHGRMVPRTERPLLKVV